MILLKKSTASYYYYIFLVFFSFQLPFGLPQVLPNWKKDLEEYVVHPEKLPIHDYRKCQK